LLSGFTTEVKYLFLAFRAGSYSTLPGLALSIMLTRRIFIVRSKKSY